MSAKEHEGRHRSRRSRNPRPSLSVFSRIRSDRSRSSRSREKEGCVFKRLESRGKSVFARSYNHNQRSYSRYTQSLSESEDNGGGHWKLRFEKKKSNGEEDDLPQPWVCEEIDPFTARIRYFNFPKTRMPSHIKTYDGKSYDDMKKAFLENYLQQKKCIKDPIEIHNIKQQDRESTKDFVKRYKLESRDVKGAPECMRISGFGGNGSLESRAEEVVSTMGPQEGNQKQNFKKGCFQNQQRPERKKDRFTLLTKTPKEIFALDKGKFKAPPPMTTLVEKRNHAKF
nr:reverse transcriptase domain-containing protein [Tanacetum cinerariifolium]